MFFQLLYIHLFRPFLKYTQANSPLPANVSPRRLCTQAAAAISKLLRLYKRSHGLRQICNIAVYIAHSASTIHLLNLPDKNAKRDITHGVKHLEEIAESWLCARRTLALLSVLARQWHVELPDEAAAVLARTDAKYAAWNQDIRSRYPSKPTSVASPEPAPVNVIQPSPNFFSPPGNIGGGSLNQHPSPESHLPRTAASYLQQRTGYQNVANPLTSPPSMSTPTSRASFDSGNSPSNIFGNAPETVLRSDGGDWWLHDQNQLAQGFAQWSAPAHDSGSVWTTAEPVTSPTMNGAPLPFVEDPELSRLFGTSGNGVMGGMAYPNESDWYQ
jgi:hypothetical protein